MSLETILTGSQSQKIINSLDGFFKKFPNLPKFLVDIVVFLAPWFALLNGIASILSPLGVGRLSMLERQFGITTPAAGRAYFNVTGIFLIGMGILSLLAFKPLLDKKTKGWTYAFWANMIGVGGSIVGIFTGYQGIIATAIGVLIGMYVWFKVRHVYQSV